MRCAPTRGSLICCGALDYRSKEDWIYHATMTIAAGTKLGRYEIRSKIGAGGMGEVYLAQDTKLDRKVALKILPAEVAADRGRMNRFVQEAKAASALNHPNIITIHEIEQIDSVNFIATEFIDGETLRQRMGSAPLKLGEVLDVAVQIAGGLSAAHAAGIVHRDIKPENIMLRRDGIVKVLDFGLAKLTERLPPESVDTEAPTSFKTDGGTVLGTAAYMSPEQARGMAVDARTDIWSLGVVLYETVAGCLPFEGSTTSEILASILNEKEPPPLARFARDVPAELERIVEKALRKDREQRYQTAKDLLLDLRRLKHKLELDAEIERTVPPELRGATGETKPSGGQEAVSAQASAAQTATVESLRTRSGAEYIITEIKQHKRGVAAILVAITLLSVAGFAYYFYSARGGSRAAIDSIAVLPLVNASNDANMDYLSDGITESIINSLSQLPKLRVVPRVAVFRYKGREIDPLKVGREMGVRAVLTGRVVQFGDKLSIQTELVDVQTESQLWGKKYDRTLALSDILAVQDELAGKISEGLRLRLTGEEQQQLTRRFTKSNEAYQLYLKGRYYWKKYTKDGVDKSIEYFNQAIEKDPSYSLAYSGLADAYVVLGVMYLPPNQVFPKAKAAAAQALAIDESLAAGHISMGAYKLFYEWDWAGAQKEAQRAKELNAGYAKAIEINTNYDDAHHFYCQALDTIGKPQDSIAEMRRALELDPFSLSMNAEMGWSLYIARDYDQAISQCRKVIELDPNFIAAYSCAAQAYEQQKMYAEAIADMNKARVLVGDDPGVMEELACAYALSGQKTEARKLLDALKERSAREYVDPGLIALIYASLGEKDQAFEWLEKAYQVRSSWMTWLKVEPKFDPLRSDPRFTDLMRRVGIT
jgi:serine/threonine protein kinase/TolB-like protein/Flp pilus assembly protein TadD